MADEVMNEEKLDQKPLHGETSTLLLYDLLSLLLYRVRLTVTQKRLLRFSSDPPPPPPHRALRNVAT
ncbi:hypothetical protein KC350_g87 [Hortaea werneckii]|nr:hypothetical protein KC350_g87 [Hortaea werneckii]